MSDIKLPSRYTITAALPYTNGPIHIGHLAGVYVPADIYARYLRLTGKDVAFVCGSDEHGVAISMKAKKEGVTPKDIIAMLLLSSRFWISVLRSIITLEPQQKYIMKLHQNSL
jgi:methionyl-tRNA synthetase